MTNKPSSTDRPTDETLMRMGEAADNSLLSEQGWLEAGEAAWLAMQLGNLAEMPDSEIDTSDIPETTDWSNAERGKFVARPVGALDALYEKLVNLNWREPVPDDLQSDVRMAFNEALAGGPNMNGDGGPTLTVNHAIDCVWATKRITDLQTGLGEVDILLTELLDGKSKGAFYGIGQALRNKLLTVRLIARKALSDGEG